MIWMKNRVLEGYFFVIICILGDPFFDSLCFGVIIHHAIFAECRWDWLHFKEQTAIFFFCFCHLAFSDWVYKGRFFGDPVCRCVWCMSSKRFDFLKFVQELDIRLIDVHVLFIELMSKRFAFSLFDVCELCMSGVIIMQLMFSIFSDLSQFPQMIFVGSD